MNVIEQLRHDNGLLNTRRQFLKYCLAGVGTAWLSSLRADVLAGEGTGIGHAAYQSALDEHLAHFVPQAKRVIFLHMAGAPSQLELFDYKPELAKLDGSDCPREFLEGQSFAFIQGVPKMLGTQNPFHRAGDHKQWISDRLPWTEKVIDDLCIIRSMHTDQFNHAPAQLLMHTGQTILGHPSIGSWVTYGLGSDNQNLPGFIVLASGGTDPDAGKSIWGSGFLPSVYQGVQCRSEGDPVLYLASPEGIPRGVRRKAVDAITKINEETHREMQDPETIARVQQYETAFRMQIHASDAFDVSREPDYIHALYGTTPGKATFANNCLLARRLAERGTRFIQLFDWGWDSHGAAKGEALNHGFLDKCKSVDRAVYGLITDLKQRGLLDDTLVIWGGEFGRTPMRENRGGAEMTYIGRDHNPGAFTIWMAGAGIKPGAYGETDPIGYRAVKDKVSVYDLQATILHAMGLHHKKLSYPFQGLDQTLTPVNKTARVVAELFA
ncbi:MAG: DUF1501 domain-containing protein [Chthoniobacterales bacterium]